MTDIPCMKILDQSNIFCFVLVKHAKPDLHCISNQVGMSPHLDTLFWLQANQLSLYCRNTTYLMELDGEALTNNFKVFEHMPEVVST